jgi:GH35 family endo-1,4-beta-xylanase
LGGFTLTNFGSNVDIRTLPMTKATYRGMEPGAKWRTEAQARIEKIRKAPLKVRVVNTAGKPVNGADVQVTMTRHAFPFGSAVAAEQLLGDGPDSEKYRQVIKQSYNRVVLENDLKWWAWQQNPERAKKAVAYLRENGIEVRGHNLVWPGWENLPRELKALQNDKAALDKTVKDHIREKASALRGQLVDWDVVNEPYTNNDLQKLLGEQILVEYFQIADRADPNARLFLNDYPPLDGSDKNNAHLNHFAKTIQYLLDNKAPLEGIGFQGHFGGNVIPPERVLSGLNRFAPFKLPIAITEFDINTTNDELQAAYMRDFMIAVFSHPQVDSVMMWGFWEGRHWFPNAALYNRDWSVKPVGKAWNDLVLKEWWTRATGKTGNKGEWETRAFMGNYDVTATHNGKTQKAQAVLGKTGQTVTVTLR